VLVALLGFAKGAGLRPADQPRAAVPTAEKLKTSAASPSGEGIKLPSSFHFVLHRGDPFSLGNSSDMFLVLRAQNGLESGWASRLY